MEIKKKAEEAEKKKRNSFPARVKTVGENANFKRITFTFSSSKTNFKISHDSEQSSVHFLRDYQKQLIPKISAMQLSKKEYKSSPKSSSEETARESSYSSSYSSFDEEPEENFQKIAQTQPKVEVPSDDDLMMNETHQGESSSQAPRANKGPSLGRMTFTLDDIPPEKWPARIQEFHSWLDTRKLTEESNYNIPLEFVSRFTGMLRDWWNSIDHNSQMQFLVLQDLSTPIRIIH
ncbi:hypothetical protein J1N35_012646 [Gossypium stocksii]|uniref:Polyprotein n=1 Tax=Gossypium stocksii TaxID=47602 RepID=A0A9D3W5I3_9ROSI|nr:hypothetical protein J1N35_012646 [Gossypium stocksii]